jgi:hypothetical protein
MPWVEAVGDHVLGFADTGLGDHGANRFDQGGTRGQDWPVGGFLAFGRQAYPKQYTSSYARYGVQVRSPF